MTQLLCSGANYHIVLQAHHKCLPTQHVHAGIDAHIIVNWKNETKYNKFLKQSAKEHKHIYDVH